MSQLFLRRASVFYLFLPNLLFFYFWTSDIYKIAGLMLCIYILLVEFKTDDFSGKKVFSSRDLFILSAFALLMTFVSGVSGLSYQTFDYWCHNTKFYELFKYEWPIRIPSDGPVIAYYYGFYLVPALYSKAVGHISEMAIFFWTFAGIFLGVCWIYQVLNKKILFVFLALTVGDLPHVIKTTFYKLHGYLYEFGDFGVEAWSNFENLLWVPNQVIPTLIIGGMLVYVLQQGINIERVVLPIALAFWWAVFPAFTLGLLVGILVVLEWVRNREKFKFITVMNYVLLPCLCCLPVLVLYLSHNTTPISGFIWQFPDRMDSRVVEYLINIGINALVFFLAFRFVKFSRVSQSTPNFPFYLALFFILVFPIYRIGKVNDFLFRGLMPLLIIVGMYLYADLSAVDKLGDFWRRARHSVSIIILTCFLVASSLIAIGRVGRAFVVNQAANYILPGTPKFEPIPYDAYDNIYEVLKDRWTQMEADQYLGKEDSFYEQFIAPIGN